jgi:peptidoglycan/xylan/chitin deacetylase (PgdA/CDA1 family)
MWTRFGLHGFSGRWKRRRSGAIILLYHRVASLRRDPWSLALTPAQFESQLSVIREYACPAALDEISSPGEPGKSSVAITFDDGYEDNLLWAEPMLRRFDIPATVFIVSGAINNGREFWWDELERILLDCGRRSRSLEITIGGKPYAWAADDYPGSVDDTDWQAWRDSPPSTAHRAYLEIYDRLFPLDSAEREKVMNRLRDWAGLESGARACHRPLSREQVRVLAQSPVIDIGIHTGSHPCLALLPAAAQRAEIVDAKADIEELTGRTANFFSYPYGKREHFSEDTVRIVHEAGFSHACANIPGLVGPDTDRLRLPRVVAPQLEGKAFAQWLEHCFQNLAFGSPD